MPLEISVEFRLPLTPGIQRRQCSQQRNPVSQQTKPAVSGEPGQQIAREDASLVSRAGTSAQKGFTKFLVRTPSLSPPREIQPRPFFGFFMRCPRKWRRLFQPGVPQRRGTLCVPQPELPVGTKDKEEQPGDKPAVPLYLYRLTISSIRGSLASISRARWIWFRARIRLWSGRVVLKYTSPLR